MKPLTFMLVAGEPSGDALAAELVRELRPAVVDYQFRLTADVQPLTGTLEPRFFGAGGPLMAESGVELAFDLTRHATVGFWEVVKRYRTFKSLFDQLILFTREHRPEVIILVDFSGFNLRFAHSIKRYVRSRRGTFNDWDPKLVYFVSPQVWASRPSRAYQIAEDFDLLLTIFPFEKDWYRQRTPKLNVQFVGHPIVDRYASVSPRKTSNPSSPPIVLLLPGSREREFQLHLPLMLAALERIRSTKPVIAKLVLPNSALEGLARSSLSPHTQVEIQIGGLADALRGADLALAASGTVTLECAYFQVPTVVLYKTSWSTYQVAKRLIRVKHLAMPNILADEVLFPEFTQTDATPENIARAGLALLEDEPRRAQLRARLETIIESLGSPGAASRAAAAIVGLLKDTESNHPLVPSAARL